MVVVVAVAVATIMCTCRSSIGGGCSGGGGGGGGGGVTLGEEGQLGREVPLQSVVEEGGPHVHHHRAGLDPLRLWGEGEVSW